MDPNRVTRREWEILKVQDFERMEAALAAERARADELQDAAHWLTDERERLQLELQDATQERDQLRARADVAEQRAARVELEQDEDYLIVERERDQLRAQRDDAVAALREMRAVMDALMPAAAHKLKVQPEAVQRWDAILQAADQRGGEVG